MFFLFPLFCSLLSAQAQISPQAVATQFSLPASTALPFPTSPLSTNDSQSFIRSNWGVSKGRIQNGPENLAFVDDPFTSLNGTAGPVLQVTYEAGSYSHDTGGAQLYSLWNSSEGSPFQSVLLSYEVAFDSGYDWVKGGKLPGLRGGPALSGCDGGSQPNGTDCFSTRLMWRTDGVGEVYAYILRPNHLCSDVNITCNDDFGVSVQRGSYSFTSGAWNHVGLVVQLNKPGRANGNIFLYYNNVLVLQQENLEFRRTQDVDIGGFYLSTFFGGSDASWATPVTTHSYYRNIQMWGSSSASTLDGLAVNKALESHPPLSWHFVFCLVAITIALYAQY